MLTTDGDVAVVKWSIDEAAATAMEGSERRTSLISETEPLNSHCFIATQGEAQKMVALKKAYAEIILNTAKEAAARVMASERRAIAFQKELTSTKDEALRMLLRLKHMIDAKTAEAETASLNQQRKIEELEAQLNEAEDIITDLRAELKQVWVELEKKKNSQVHSLDEQNVKQVASFVKSTKPEASVSSPNEELQYARNCDVKNEPRTVNILDDKCCNTTKQTELMFASNLEDYAHESDYASIIMRRKEAERCKNGCTQRIRAFEGNLLEEKLLTQDVYNQHFGNGLLVKDSDRPVAKFCTLSARMKKREINKHIKCQKRPKWKIFSCCRSCLLSSCKTHTNENTGSDKVVCSLPSIKHCAISKWKRKKRRHSPVTMKSSVFEHCKPSFVLKQCSPVSVSASVNGKYCEVVAGSTVVTESVQAINKFEVVENAMEKHNELLNAYILGNFEGSTSQNLTGPSSNMKVEAVDIPSTDIDLEDAKAFEENYDSPGQADDCSFLKYTFQRKRKKESSGKPDEKTDSEKSTAKRMLEGKQNGSSEPF